METTSKKRLWIYIAIAYGVAAVMTLFMAIGKGRDVDLTAFVNVQMMYPACGVILGKLIAKKDGEKVTTHIAKFLESEVRDDPFTIADKRRADAYMEANEEKRTARKSKKGVK